MQNPRKIALNLKASFENPFFRIFQRLLSGNRVRNLTLSSALPRSNTWTKQKKPV
jgi:hypothetical protein